jgi:hypothetical protein
MPVLERFEPDTESVKNDRLRCEHVPMNRRQIRPLYAVIE